MINTFLKKKNNFASIFITFYLKYFETLLDIMKKESFKNRLITQSDKKTASNKQSYITDNCTVIDLFCGIGGLTNGFVQESFSVAAGFDIDATCRYAYEHNNSSLFIEKNVEQISKKEIELLYNNKPIKILVG